MMKDFDAMPTIKQQLSYFVISFLFFGAIALLFSVADARSSSVDSTRIYFSGKEIGPATNLYAITLSGDVAKITDDARWRDMNADISNSGLLVYMSNRKERAERDLIELSKNRDTINLFTVSIDGGSPNDITRSQYLELDPRFSPDGTHLAYIRQKNAQQEVVVSLADGSNQVVLASADQVFDLSWHPEGNKIAYASVSGLTSTINVVDVSNKGSAEQYTENTLITALIEKPPENTAMIVIRDPAPNYQQQLVSVQWSPDGKNIAYIVNELSGSERSLRIFNSESKRHQIVSPKGSHVQNPVLWARDGQSILYSALIDYSFRYDEAQRKQVYTGGMQILRSDVSGEYQQLTAGDHRHGVPVFSPDESHIAFLYGDELNARSLSLRTMRSDGSDVRELYRNVASDSFLHWR